MGWNRGLGRRTEGRLTWDKKASPKPVSLKYSEKKTRMQVNARKKRERLEDY